METVELLKQIRNKLQEILIEVEQKPQEELIEQANNLSLIISDMESRNESYENT